MSLVSAEVQRRATLLLLALELYHRVHDQYPRSLDKLAPTFLSKIPLDPFNGEPFHYLPRGAELPIENAYAYGETLPAGQPFFWSVSNANIAQLLRTHSYRENGLGDRLPDPPRYQFRSLDFRSVDRSTVQIPINRIFPLPRKFPNDQSD